MNKISKTVVDFVTEYKIDVSPEGICFDARLLIFTKNLFAQVQSEILIISSVVSGIDKVYILNPHLGIGHFPNEIETGTVDILHEPGKGLVIKGHYSFYGFFKLVIQPINHDCNELTTSEIKSKLYN